MTNRVTSVETSRKFTVEMDEETALAFLAVYQYVGGNYLEGPRARLAELSDALLVHYDDNLPWTGSVSVEGDLFITEKGK